jgi:hypothetical protein
MNLLHNPEDYDIRTGPRLALGMILLMEFFDRAECGIFGKKKVPYQKVIDATQKIDPGYCIDAPEVMPAGGMSNFQVPPCDDSEPEFWLPEQMVCERPTTPITSDSAA